MTLPLDIGNDLVDRGKSALLLYYLASATEKTQERDLNKRKVELTIKQLKKISTKEIQKHLEQLETHIQEAIRAEKQIQTTQKKEDETHIDLKQRITQLEHKLTRYVQTQEGRKKRIQEIEDKVKQKFQTKQELKKQLQQDIQKLQALYNDAKKEKTNKQKLEQIEQRIRQLKILAK